MEDAHSRTHIGHVLPIIAVGFAFAFAAGGDTPSLFEGEASQGRSQSALTLAPMVLDSDPALRLRVREVAAGQHAQVGDAPTRLSTARNLIRQGKNRQALSLLTPSSELFPDRRALLRGRALEALGEHEAAVRAFEQAFDLGQTPELKTQAARHLAKAYGAQGAWHQQLYYLEALSAGDPDSARLGLERARVLERLGRFEEAYRLAFDLVLGSAPPEVSRGTTEILTLSGSWTSGSHRLGRKFPGSRPDEGLTGARVLRSGPEEPSHRARSAGGSDQRAPLAEFAKSWGLVERAPLSQARRTAERFSRTFVDARAMATVLEAELQARQGRPRAALAALTSLSLEDLPDPAAERALRRLVELATRVRNPGVAQAALTALEERPSVASTELAAANAVLGEFYFRRRSYRQAADILRRAADLEVRGPESSDRRWRAALAALLSHDTKLAKSLFEETLALGEPELRWRARYWLGRLHEGALDHEAAMAAYAKVEAYRPLSDIGFWAESRRRALGERSRTAALPKGPGYGLAPAPRAGTGTNPRRGRAKRSWASESTPQLGPENAQGSTEVAETGGRSLTLAEALAGLGPERPLAVDRALALATAGRVSESFRDLGRAARTLPATANPPDPAIDLLRAFDAKDHGFMLRRLARPGEPMVERLLTGDLEPWRALYPRPFARLVEVESRRRKIDPLLVYAVMRAESGFSTRAASPRGAQGLMQVLPSTARGLLRNANPDANADDDDELDLKEPGTNVRVGVKFLGQLVARYDGNVALALAAYNAGPGVTDRWIGRFAGLETDLFVELIPYRETRQYVRRTLENYRIYARLYGASLPTVAIGPARLAREPLQLAQSDG